MQQILNPNIVLETKTLTICCLLPKSCSGVSWGRGEDKGGRKQGKKLGSRRLERSELASSC